MSDFQKKCAIDILDKYSTVDDEELKKEYKSKISGTNYNCQSYGIFCHSLENIVFIDEMVSSNVSYQPTGKILSILRLCISHMLKNGKKEKYPAIINAYCGIAYQFLQNRGKVDFINGVLNTIATKLSI